MRAPNPIAFLTRFWEHFGTILGPFWEVLGSFCFHFGCPGASGGASWGSARPSWGLFGCFRTSKPQCRSILDEFGTILDQFWTHGIPFWTFRPPFWSPRCPILEGPEMILPHQASKPLQASKPPSLQASNPPSWGWRNARSVPPPHRRWAPRAGL